MHDSDSYYTIGSEAQTIYKEKSSKFVCYAYHVENEQDIKEILEVLYKKHYDATHHCYAWRLGSNGDTFRANDDGEPSGTAGKPILGQLLSRELTNTLIVIVRYFGGTKLGVSGLITAYKESAATVIEVSDIKELTVNAYYLITFDYIVMNDVMRVIKEEQPEILTQEFDNLCNIRLSIRQSLEQRLIGKLDKVEGIKINFEQYK